MIPLSMSSLGRFCSWGLLLRPLILGQCSFLPVVIKRALANVQKLYERYRGAAPSEGRTSWTAKPEQGDYISVIGFLAYYVYHLLSSPSSSIPPPRQQPPVMCLAGYSYGAMITTRIPPLEEILAYFATPLIHSAEADVRLRAQHLAEVQNALLSSEDAASPRRSQGMRFGEGDSRKRMRRSTSSSFGALGGFHQQQQQKEERIQKSVKDLLVRAKRVRVHAHRENRYPRSSNQSQDRSESNTSSNNNNEGKETGREDGNKEHAEEECLHPVERGVTFRSAYIAVSPPVGLMTRLATMSFSFSNPFYSLSSSSPTSTSNSPSSSISSSLSSWLKRPQTQTQTTTTTQHQHAMTVTDYESKLTTSPTMVIYGDQDGFINQRRIREWTRQLSQTRIQTQREQEGNNVQRQASQFRYVEVTGTGHFWVEGDSIYKCEFSSLVTFHEISGSI